MQREITPSSLILGIIIAIVMTAANVYLGLYAGMTVSASIPAAVLAMGFYKTLFPKKDSLHQSNIVQTMASAGESLAAGVIFTLPALVLVGSWKSFELVPTTLIAISGGLLGVLFMIPLRKTLIQDEQDLTYPEGVACAAVLQSANDDAEDKGFRVILKGLAVGGIFKFVGSGFKMFLGSVELAKKIGGSVLFFGFDVSPALLAVGYIVNIHIATLVLLGGAIGFFVLIPLLGTPLGTEDLSAVELAMNLWSEQGRYLGVGAMIVGGVWSIFSVRSGIVKGARGLGALKGSGKQVERSERDISLMSMSLVMLICIGIVFWLYSSMIDELGITIFTTVLMVFCSFLFVGVSSYIVGLVGSSNNPVSGMTISALLVSAGLFLALGFKGDSAILATLGVAAVVCCAACTAGDCSQDLKTGHMIGSTPKYQQIAQMIGVIVPALVIAPTLTILHEVYVIGEGLKAPQAMLFASITSGLFGEGELPISMVFYGAILGIAVILIDTLFLRKKSFRLHLMPIAVGIYLPVTLAVPIFLGGLIRFVVDKSRKVDNESKDKGVLLGSGFIAGEAIMGVFIAAILYYFGDAMSVSINPMLREYLSIVAFIAVASYLLRMAKKS